MIVYFADRSLDIIGTASTNLPDSIVILDDEKTDDVKSGVKTFTATFAYDDDTRELITNYIAVGNFLLRSADNENEFYTIITTKHNSLEQTVEAYCEDAGLDLLNTNADEFANDTAHNCAWYINKYLPAGWEIGINELTGSTLTLSWDGDSTVTERLLSIVNSFGGELDYSYEVNGLRVVRRFVNLYQNRGSTQVTHQLRLGQDISNITTQKSVENLATALIATGDTLSGQKKPINLSGCDFSSDGEDIHTPANPYDDFQIVGKQVRCISAMARWSSALDTDGKIVREFSYSTKNKRTLFKRAVTELKKVINEEVTYDLEFLTFPKSARVGDWVHVIDDKNNLYLKGRILSLTKSITKAETKATLGEWIIQSGGIAERLAQFAQGFQSKQVATTVVTLTSSAGTVFDSSLVNTTITVQVTYGDAIVTNQADLEEIFGDTVALAWYKDGTAITSTPTHVIADDGFTLQLVNETVAALSNYEVKVTV